MNPRIVDGVIYRRRTKSEVEALGVDYSHRICRTCALSNHGCDDDFTILVRIRDQVENVCPGWVEAEPVYEDQLI